MPLNPKKCWGKNVRFTPTNIRKNCAFDHRSCMVTPNISGNQWYLAAKIANTAPILRT